MLFVYAFASLMSACAGTGGTVRKDAPLLYPPLPNKPRLQFLTAYTTAEDVEEKNSFMDFVVGREEINRSLSKPYGATIIPDDRIVVTDPGANDVVVFDLAKREFRRLRGNTGGGHAKNPINLTSGPDGTIYLADAGRNQILVYGPDENFIHALGVDGEFRPTDVAVHGDELYVCDVQHHQIAVLDRRTGKELRRIGSPGREKGQLYLPTNLSVGPDGDIYVSEIGNFRVQRFRPDGTPVAVIGSPGDMPGSMARPKGVGVSPDGHVYVVDAAFENVQIFDQEGRLLLFFGGPGAEPGNLYLPAGIEVTTRGVKMFQSLADPRLKLRYLVVVVSQYGPRRINVFGFGDWTWPEGSSTGEPATGEDSEPGQPAVPPGD